ncbi:hypothetical protein [Lyngbya aestuarii]|uniref:hypothetical protein n=1 Tax=Lyngbya aestuarii TaxID=118322 RepID=UPI00403D5DEF
MLEKLLLAITVTFSVYISAGVSETNPNPMSSAVQSPVIPAQAVSSVAIKSNN